MSGPTGKIRAVIFGFSKFLTKFKFIYRRTNGAENSVSINLSLVILATIKEFFPQNYALINNNQNTSYMNNYLRQTC